MNSENVHPKLQIKLYVCMYVYTLQNTEVQKVHNISPYVGKIGHTNYDLHARSAVERAGGVIYR